MSNEINFDRALELAGNFFLTNVNFILFHHKLPSPHYLEVDNIAQKNNIVFVFEGKSRKEQLAIKQLKARYESLVKYRLKYINLKILYDYNLIRLFYYSFKNKNLIEYNSRGVKILQSKFNNLKELSRLLQKSNLSRTTY